MSGTLRLVDRLRGLYVLPVNDGAGLLNGKDTFTRQFDTPPIQHEAAQTIEVLAAALGSTSALLRLYKGNLDPDVNKVLGDADRALSQALGEGQ